MMVPDWPAIVSTIRVHRRVDGIHAGGTSAIGVARIGRILTGGRLG